jgi:tetratricopeptide (TPR) repeat protein
MTPLLLSIIAGHMFLATQAQTPVPPPSAQKLFESGQYEALLERVAAAKDETAPPDALYLAGQAALKLEPPDRDAAKTAYERLEGEGDETRAWTFVARSAALLIDHAADPALAAAQRAVAIAPSEMFAHYQLGLAQGEKRAWANAAAAFEKATTLTPTFAYAHYYAGMSYYQVKRLDKMSAFFERFLKLAPQAPERPAVEAIMRTMRGR